jgi:nitrate reductase gamma subunit
MPWLLHLGLMLGYVTMLLLVMIFIEPLQAGPEINWSVHIFGYLATIGLLAGAIYFIENRFRKGYIQYKKSHHTDWVFVWLLLIIVLTGIAQHIFHRTGMIEAANVTYVIHLMAVVPWLLRMPFSKWAHMAYRPMAMYLAAVQRAAFARQTKSDEIILAAK